MEDKEVGELWEKLQSDCRTGVACDNHGDYFRLILKLIEERALHRYWKSVNEYPPDYAKACTDFGIPFSEYQAAKEGR